MQQYTIPGCDMYMAQYLEETNVRSGHGLGGNENLPHKYKYQVHLMAHYQLPIM